MPEPVSVFVGALVEGDGRKHQESIKESYCDRGSRDLYAGICANPHEGVKCMNRMIDLSD